LSRFTFCLAVFRRRLQYFPDRHLVDAAQAGLSGIEDLLLTTDDGEVLVSWYVPSTEGHPPILYFHGNGGALVDRVPRFFGAYGERIRASCYLSHRGYGGSTGSPPDGRPIHSRPPHHRDGLTHREAPPSTD